MSNIAKKTKKNDTKWNTLLSIRKDFPHQKFLSMHVSYLQKKRPYPIIKEAVSVIDQQFDKFALIPSPDSAISG